MEIHRYVIDKILKQINSRDKRAVIVYGPRRVGKTTVIKQVMKSCKLKCMLVQGDDISVRQALGSQSIKTLRNFIGDSQLLIIDEAQLIDNIGLNIKLIVDNIQKVKVLATGSSSFKLSNQIGEPLVGRKWEYLLYPVAQLELSLTEGRLDTMENLPDRLIYGGYPEVVISKNVNKKSKLLMELVNSYLFKDILMLENLRMSDKLIDLLRLVSFQIGSEVSIRELSNSLNVDFKTVERYLDLLEKAFIVKRVSGFSRNLRKEVTKNCRFYFYDNGVRNAVINNFNEIPNRNDVGQLWENYLFMERLKVNAYKERYSNIYFWRTYDQKEVDLVEERGGKLYGYEFKWVKKRGKSSKLWLETYENAKYKVIDRENYLEFIGK